MSRSWPALEIESAALDDPPDAEDLLPAVLDDFAPQAIEDLAERPLPPGGLWDPTFPPIPEPAPTPLRWRVFFSTSHDRDRAARAVHARLPRLKLTAIDVDDEDWAARSQAALTAVRAGRFLVAPPWHLPTQADPEVTVVVIEPSMGFGTGHHPTTRLCLRLLSDVDLTGRRVLDVGTGSGVLAMAAALGGAGEVTGVDVDADAIASARASATLNPLPPGIRFDVADVRTSSVAPADIVLANLTGGMLRTTAHILAALKTSGGQLIVSGFDQSEEPAVRAAFATLSQTTRLEEAGWVAIEFE